MRTLILPLLFSALLGACFGGDDEVVPDAGNQVPAPDARVTPDGMTTPMATAFVVAGDYDATGIATTVRVPGLAVDQGVAAGIVGADPVVRRFGDRLYILDRFNGDTVTVVEADGHSLVAQISTGSGSNPQDVAVKGDKLYVAALGAAGVLVLDVTRPADGVIDTIDLAALDETDSLPDCNTLYLAGETLLVACARLDNFVPQGPATIAVIDTTDDTLTGSFELMYAGPIGWIEPTSADSAAGGDLLLSTVPSFTDYSVGCLERIDVSGAPAAAGCLVSNQQVGGYISQYAWGEDDTLYLATTDCDGDCFGSANVSALTTYDAGTETLAASPITPAEQTVTDFARCPTGHLVVADGTFGAAGVRVYDDAGTELTTEALDVGIPPTFQHGIVCY
jgi:hypothetical protein